MSQSDTRVLTRNTYSLDIAGVLAHVRDTIVVRFEPLDVARSAGPYESPRSRGGPASRVAEDHGLADSWRIR